MILSTFLKKYGEKTVLYGVIILLAILQFSTCNKQGNRELELANLINSLNDTIKVYKNADSNNVARISVLETESLSDFISLGIKDGEIKDLQNVVIDYKKQLKKAGSSVTNFTSQTKVTNTNKPTVSNKDTVYKDNLVYIYPEYSDSLFNEWISYRSRINKNESYFDLKITNKYSVIIGEEGKGKKAKPFVDVINYNPYSTTDTLRAYKVSVKKVKPKRYGIGAILGYGVTYNLKPSPFIGVGITRNFIRF
jgi:hypothetical protein